MDITTMLAEIWGPVLLAAGLGFFFSPKYYVKVYRDLERSPFAVLFFGMAAIAAGVVQVRMHTLWNSLPEIIITLLGWALLIKGVVCTVFPGFADRGADWAMSAKIVPILGGIIVIIGAYLSWVGYFA